MRVGVDLARSGIWCPCGVRRTFGEVGVFSPSDLDDANWIEAGVLRDQRGIPARRRVEDEEADLIAGNVDRPFEADAGPLLRQLLGGRACAEVPGGALSGSPLSKVGLDEEAWHVLDATAEAMPW